MDIVNKIYNAGTQIYSNSFDKAYIKRKRQLEMRKTKNVKWKAIADSITLSDEQKQQIDNFFVENYGEKVPHFWHKLNTAITGNFDVKYFTDLLYIPEFENFMTPYKYFVRALNDKNFLPIIAKSVGVDTPTAYISRNGGLFFNNKGDIISFEEALKYISNIGEAFIKPTIDTGSGQNCAVVDFSSGKDKVTGKTVEEIISPLGNNFSIQERLVCSEDIKRIYDNSVNTFRVVTYIWKDEIKCLPLIMRIGSGGGVLDNVHAGGMFIAIENDGTLHKTAYTDFNDKYTEHPDTKIVYDGYNVSNVEKVISAAKKMQATVPQVGVVSWDFTIDKNNNPVLIEANARGGSLWLIEKSYGKGAFGEDTAEVLRWLQMNKKVSVKDREKLLFGKGV